jgi:ABC-type tungstate transport system substrate-binding protein
VPQLSLSVGVVSHNQTIATDLGVTVLFGEGVAEVPCAVLVGGLILPRSRGADHVVAGHHDLGSFDL